MNTNSIDKAYEIREQVKNGGKLFVTRELMFKGSPSNLDIINNVNDFKTLIDLVDNYFVQDPKFLEKVPLNKEDLNVRFSKCKTMRFHSKLDPFHYLCEITHWDDEKIYWVNTRGYKDSACYKFLLDANIIFADGDSCYKEVPYENK